MASPPSDKSNNDQNIENKENSLPFQTDDNSPDNDVSAGNDHANQPSEGDL